MYPAQPLSIQFIRPKPACLSSSQPLHGHHHLSQGSVDFALTFKRVVFQPSQSHGSCPSEITRCKSLPLSCRSRSVLIGRGIIPMDSGAFEWDCRHSFPSLTCVPVISKPFINQLQPGNVLSLASETGVATPGQDTRLR